MRAFVRVLLVVAVTLTLALLLSLALLVGGWHRKPRASLRTLTSWTWGRVLCAILGVRVLPEGSPPRGAALLAPNHMGYLDLVVLLSQCRTFFLSRADVRHWPVIGWIVSLVGTLYIERARRADAGRAAGEVEQRLADGHRVVVFLEGRASEGDQVLPYRSSLLAAAVRTEVPCVPVALRFELPEDAPGPTSRLIAWCDDTPFGTHVWRLCSLPRILARLRFLPPRSGTDRKVLAKALEADVREALTGTAQRLSTSAP